MRESEKRLNIVFYAFSCQTGTFPSYSKSTVFSRTQHTKEEVEGKELPSRLLRAQKERERAARVRELRERRLSLSLFFASFFRARTNTKSSPERNEKIMVEVIEILDSDEEGDERVRIVQQNFEPRLRPIREEEGNDNTNSNNNNRDEDVVITGARRFLSVFPPLLPFFFG
jgi:hypothetical protein